MQKWVIRLGLVFGLAAGLLYWLSNSLATFATSVPPIARPAFSPASLQIPSEDVSTVSADGLNLKAWWIPPARLEARPAVIIVHGLGASKEHMMNYLLLAHRLQHPVLAIDLRGHGESAPSPTTLGWSEQQDLHAWLQWLQREHPSSPPILWGTSMGAVTCLLTATHEPQLSGIIADAPFTTLRQTLARHGQLFFGLPEFPFTPLTCWQIERRFHFDVDDVDAIAAVKKIHVPLLVLAAEKDRRMLLPTVRAIFDAANEPKQWWVIPGSGHETRTFKPDYCAVVENFLNSVSATNVQTVR